MIIYIKLQLLCIEYTHTHTHTILGHLQTRAFVTHCETNGLYEGIYHGISMVGIPLFGGQYNNTVHVKAKGAAVKLDLHKMTSSDLFNALKAVITDPS